MNARLVALAVAWLTPAVAFAQHFHHRVEATGDEDRESVCKKPYAPPVCFNSDKRIKWLVHTGKAEAQWCFEQGLTMLYGFNYEDAIRNFERALVLDGDLAIAHWGIALAAGPNINIDQDSVCAKRAYDEAKAAMDKVKAHPEIPDLEKALIGALWARYRGYVETPSEPLRPVDYAVAMRGVWETYKPHPQVAAIYAESLLDLRPWALYDNAMRPAIDTEDVVKVLLAAYKQTPEAIGANHYLIHAVEAGAHPEAAEYSAGLLMTAVPSSGHLLHMPSHTYFLMGDYDNAIKANTNAINRDEDLKGPCGGSYKDYSKNTECQQLYYGHYLAHNYYFRAVAQAFRGYGQKAIDDAVSARKHVERFVANEPGLQRYMAAELMLRVAHGRWAEVLAYPEPPETCWSEPFKPTGCRILRSIYFWAQGVARTKDERYTVADARASLQKFRDERARITPPTCACIPAPTCACSSPPPVTGWGNNNALAVLAIAEDILRARIAWAEEGKRAEAIEHLKLAVTYEDALVYDEPPQWVFPARQALGGAYLARGTKPDLEAAVTVFCADLRKHRKSGRSLFGLAIALGKLGNAEWRDWYGQEFEKAWRGAPRLEEDALWLLTMPVGDASGSSADAGPGEERWPTATAAEPDPKTDPCRLVPSAP